MRKGYIKIPQMRFWGIFIVLLLGWRGNLATQQTNIAIWVNEERVVSFADEVKLTSYNFQGSDGQINLHADSLGEYAIPWTQLDDGCGIIYSLVVRYKNWEYRLDVTPYVYARVPAIGLEIINKNKIYRKNCAFGYTLHLGHQDIQGTGHSLHYDR